MKDAHAKGITLIEMIMVIIVLGIAIPALLRSWADVSWRSVRSEALADSTFFAQAMMEEIESKQFDENISSPWSAPLGPEGGESREGSGNAGFDDVDDYNEYSDVPAAGYTRCVTVDYVALSGTTWEGTCAPSFPSGCAAPVCSSSDTTAFKRIIVRVSRNDGIIRDVHLTALKGAY
jgi:type II secretory pathway pseudopilin PulG